ncbi:tetratricopeptide repeat protein [Mesoterricola sediminis]|uniref:tetratricopeptide repeat protein n=1 Tax=Mesoterricola sediminis TaxID=2927980 RepID=UPI001FAEC5CA|nr:tetratricopeptide repeat protein [Mesoterricola sediminis]
MWAKAEPAAAPARAELQPAIALSHCAERLKPAFQTGDPVAIQAAVQDVELLRRTYGTLDVLPLVEAMTIFARDLGRKGSPAAGIKVLDTVERWAPRNPSVLGARIVLARQQGPQGWVWSIADLLELTRARLTNPDHRWLWTLQHLAWARVMAALLLWGTALALGLRYRRVWRTTWEDPLRHHAIHPHVVALLGAFIVTLPVVFGLDPGLAAMLWLWILAPFLTGPEVRVALAVILIQMVHPVLTLVEPLASPAPRPSLVTLQLRPQPAPPDERILAGLSAHDRTFLAGWRQLQSQDWPRAAATFEALAKESGDRAEVVNNLGVARYQMGNVQGAQACFDEAATLAPRRGEILLNQSVVAFRQMDGPLGFAKQEDARHFAPETFNRILAANQARTDQRTFALPLPDTPERIAALARAIRPERPASGGGIHLYTLLNLLLPLAAAGLFYLRLSRSIAQAHPSQCARCGEPFHTTDSPDAWVCSKCHHLFVLKDGLHGESRKRKVEEVAGFQRSQRWVHRFLAFALPGTDLLLAGETRAGMVEFSFLCFAAGVVLATGRPLRYPGEVLQDPATVWLPMGLVLLAILFLRSWLKLLPRRG